MVLFDEMIFPLSVKGPYGSVYRATANSTQEAVLGALGKAEFIPAVAHSHKEAIDFRGTVMFFATQTPHLRVFANQDPQALAHFA